MIIEVELAFFILRAVWIYTLLVYPTVVVGFMLIISFVHLVFYLARKKF